MAAFLACANRLAPLLAKQAPDSCWLWYADRTSDGHGCIYVSNFEGTGFRRFFVHRLSYEHFKGPIPAKKLVRHTCDVRLCWNPAHLEVGTQADNVRDMVARGRAKFPPKKAAAVVKSLLAGEKTNLVKRFP